MSPLQCSIVYIQYIHMGASPAMHSRPTILGLVCAINVDMIILSPFANKAASAAVHSRSMEELILQCLHRLYANDLQCILNGLA